MASGKDVVMDCGSSEGNASEATVEIKIKTLDSQTYTSHGFHPTTVEALVEHRITGFHVIDADWKLVGLVSDYDLLALGYISGSARIDTGMFPKVDSTWKTFNEVQNLLSKTDGKLLGNLTTPVPLVVRENTNLQDAARLLLETKYCRLPVVDGEGKLGSERLLQLASDSSKNHEKNSESSNPPLVLLKMEMKMVLASID